MFRRESLVLKPCIQGLHKESSFKNYMFMAVNPHLRHYNPFRHTVLQERAVAMSSADNSLLASFACSLWPQTGVFYLPTKGTVHKTGCVSNCRESSVGFSNQASALHKQQSNEAGFRRY
jgi:hypothetical protein